MKLRVSFVTLCICCSLFTSGQVKNTSYINKSGEKVLQLSIVLPLGKEEAWKYFSEDPKLSKWIAPVAHIELRNGGYLATNYDQTKTLFDSNSIRLGIISYLENELLILKVELNDHFTKKVQDEDQNLQEIIQLVATTPGKTKIVSSMVGWGQGKDWEKTYDFFLKGNEWTYAELLKLAQ